MQYKFSNLIEKYSDPLEVEYALNSNKIHMDSIKNHMLSVPFESEPYEFLKVLSSWQSKKIT